MKHLFVPYELAVKLKEKGFNEECLGSWNPVHGLIIDDEVFTSNISAPLYQQVIDWFREKHKIFISINVSLNSIKFKKPELHFNMDILKNKQQPSFKSSRSESVDYYEKLNEAIEEALKLIL